MACPTRWPRCRLDLDRRDLSVDASQINIPGCGDIIYLHTREGWLPLAVVLETPLAPGGLHRLVQRQPTPVHPRYFTRTENEAAINEAQDLARVAWSSTSNLSVETG